MPDLHAAILARLDELDADARNAMRYTSGNWTVVPGGSMVDIDPKDIEVEGGVIKADSLVDAVMQTASDPFVAEHIVAFRPPVALGITGAIRAVLAQHEHVPGVEPDFDTAEFAFGCCTCHRDSHCGNTMAHGWCLTVLAIADKLGIPTDPTR